MLLVSEPALGLPCLLLVCAALLFGLDACLGRLKPLSLDQLGITHLLVLFLLCLHDRKLVLFEHFHAGLLERLKAEHVEHGLDLPVKVEQLVILIEDLGGLTVLFCGHLRLEQRHRGPVQVELGGDAHFLRRWLVGQIFDVLVGLEHEMLPSGYRLRRGDVPVRVDGHDTLWGLIEIESIN